MFDILNLMLLGASAISAPYDLIPDANYVYPAKGEVAFVSLSQTWRHDATTCHFTGLMAPFARDWEEIRDDGFAQIKLPPEPDKSIGYAYVINKKSCPGQPDEVLFNTAEKNFPFMMQDPKGTMMFREIKLYTRSLESQKEADWPKWLPQVLKLIEKSAAANPAAKEFLDFTKQAAEASKIANKEVQPVTIQ